MKILQLCYKPPFPAVDGGSMGMHSLTMGLLNNGHKVKVIAFNSFKHPSDINKLPKEYIDKTKKLIQQEQERVFQLLDQSEDFHPYKPHGNFILVKIIKDGLTSSDLFLKAIKEGMMIRDCSDFMFLDEHFFRFCFLFPEENDLLLNCLLNS